MACALGFLIISPIAEPEPGFSRAIVRFLRSVPHFLDGVWQSVADGLAAFAIAVVVLAAVRRRARWCATSCSPAWSRWR